MSATTTTLAIREATWKPGQNFAGAEISGLANWRIQRRKGDSLSAGRDHLNSVGRDDADMSCPRRIRRDEGMYKRCQPLGRRRMNSEQGNPGLFQWTSTLNGNLPKILVKRQHDAGFGFRQIQQDDVLCSRVIRASPQNVVALGSKHVNNRLRKVLVGEEVHLRRNWKRLVFVGQVTGVRQTSQNVLSRQARVVGENVILRLARCQELQNELDGETRAADHRLS
jgi:hypothetical protein